MRKTNISRQNFFYDTDIFKVSLALGIGVTLIYLAFLKPGIWGEDGQDMLEVAKSLVTKHNFTTLPRWGVLGADGQYYSDRYPLLPIVAVPFVAIGLILANLLDLPFHYVAAICVLVLSILLTAATTVLVALLALRLGSTKREAYLAALSFAFGTIALVYAQQFFAEPLLALLTAASLYLVMGETKREQIIASILTVLAVTAKPAGVVVGPILSAYLLVKRRPLHIALSPAIGTGIGLMLYLVYNYIRFGSLVSFGQNLSSFGFTGTGDRFLGLLFSPGAGGGLLWYCPVVILAVLGFSRALKAKALEALMIVAVFLAYLVLYSFWEFGGWNWGPRFLVPALPGLLALTGLLGKRWRKWLLALTLIGFIVNAPTLVSFYQRYYAEALDGGYIKQALSLWGSSADAPLVQVWGAAYRQLNDALASDVKDLLRETGTSASSSGKLASAQLLHTVAVWWWVLPAVGIPLWVGVALAFILIVMGAWVLLKGWASLHIRTSK
jgi:hypothetical protein